MYDEKDYKELSDEFYGEPAGAAAFLDNSQVATFLEMHGEDKGFECAVFRMMKSPTTGTVQRAHQVTYRDIIPGAEPVVQQFGPGEYDWQLVSAKHKGDGAAPIVVHRIFVGPHWEKMHRVFQRAEKRRELKERAEEYREDAEEARAMGMLGLPYGNQQQQQLGVKEILELMSAARGPAAAPATTDPMAMLIMSKMLDKPQGINWQGIAAVAAAFGVPQVAGGLLQRLSTPVVAPPNPFDEITKEIVRAAMSNKLDQLQPPEPDTPWYAEVLQGLATSLPTIVQTLTLLPKASRASVAQQAIAQYPKGKELLDALKADPTARAHFEKMLDREFSEESVETVLSAMGLEGRVTERAAAQAGAPAA